jgi:tRNA threonylcarbamoyladenosine biosynthesis protein TsaB
LLIVETSGRVGQVALASGDHLVRERRLDETRRHARDLAPAVAELLAAEGWQPRELHGVLVSRGPGSYTGLRVGLMAAKVFAYATGAALIAVDTFAAIAAQAPAEVAKLDILADAQQEKVYVQRFVREVPGGNWEAPSPLAIRPLAEWLATRESDVWVSGPGLRPYGSKLPPGSRLLDSAKWDPQAASLLRLGLARFREGRREDPWTLEPLYLRPSAAEEQWQNR